MPSFSQYWGKTEKSEFNTFLVEKRTELQKFTEQFTNVNDKIDKIIRKHGETAAMMKDFGEYLGTCSSTKFSDQYSKGFMELGSVLSRSDQVCMTLLEKIEFQQNLIVNIQLQLKNIEMTHANLDKNEKLEPILRTALTQFEIDYKEYLVFKNNDFKCIIEGFVQFSKALNHEMNEINI
jgi:hypothetical protein